jgi:hypothetical protein
MRFVVCLLLAALPLTAATKDVPSRAADKGCKWEKLSDANLGLEAWVERCDYGFRKIDFLVKDKSLVQRYSDGGAPEPVIDVIDLQPGETPERGLERIFAARTKKKIAARCVLAPYKDDSPRPGAKRFTFLPNAAYAKELNKEAKSDEVGDPPCGDWGDSPDGIQYFEIQPSSGARKVLFVRVGQDIPLFDEQTLKLLTAKK